MISSMCTYMCTCQLKHKKYIKICVITSLEYCQGPFSYLIHIFIYMHRFQLRNKCISIHIHSDVLVRSSTFLSSNLQLKQGIRNLFQRLKRRKFIECVWCWPSQVKKDLFIGTFTKQNTSSKELFKLAHISMITTIINQESEIKI